MGVHFIRFGHLERLYELSVQKRKAQLILVYLIH